MNILKYPLILIHKQELNYMDQPQNLPRDVYQACAWCAGDGCDACYNGTTKTSYFYKSTKRLAPRPDGLCYCGYKRTICLNFVEYGYDCQGFN